MNPFKLFALLAVLLLTACASQSPSPAPPPQERTVGPLARSASAASPTTPNLTARPSAAPLPERRYTGPLTAMSEFRTTSDSVTAMSPPVDLWDRIRRGYAMPDLESNLVRDREQWYSARPDYLFRMTERSRKYLFHIVEELELRGMPTELALLPFVESAFNPQAVSSAKAAGMWQFMPATGKHFELKQNAFRDDRRDVLASTRAALDYLQRLYGMFGDWHLALAAYNWGEGSVGRAIGKNKKAGLPTGYTDINMPMETRFYVPKLQAIKNIVANPAAFNSTLPLIENHPYFQTVTIRRDIDVNLAAKLAEVPLDDFRALNPSVNKPVILASGTPLILLPWDNAAIFQTNLDAYAGGRLASWTVWVAPSTLRAADVAKKFGMGEAEFRAVNNIPARMLIRPGSSLLVPRAAHLDQDVSGHVADNGQLSLAPEVSLKRITVRAAKGDTVASIARRYKTTPANVAQWNQVASTTVFKPKQAVVVYVTAPSARKKAPTAKAQARAKAKPKVKAQAKPKQPLKKP
ncbi:transglycosylase SLT domain-containing protein [Rhodoferax sp.]|uniref:transglycosylase SLT domain-containing protein n=1 Tax=Rhodoferax sp. TaxID=50421 RepID=UPI003784E1E0